MPDPKYNLILTRPRDRSEEFVAGLPPEVLAAVAIHYTPLLQIVHASRLPDLGAYRGVIFSSATAVRLAGSGKGLPAFCVGERTTQEALDAGFDARMAGVDANQLIGALTRDRPASPLMHLHGKYTRGDIADRLSSAGIETKSCCVYDQVAQQLTAEARNLLGGSKPVIVPLFSPRTAQIFFEQSPRLGSGVEIIALSPAVAEPAPSEIRSRIHVADEPTAASVRSILMRIISA